MARLDGLIGLPAAKGSVRMGLSNSLGVQPVRNTNYLDISRVQLTISNPYCGPANLLISAFGVVQVAYPLGAVSEDLVMSFETSTNGGAIGGADTSVTGQQNGTRYKETLRGQAMGETGVAPSASFTQLFRNSMYTNSGTDWTMLLSATYETMLLTSA
jgi:hypothetical protein